MCKKVDLLLDKFEKEINNPDYNISELCKMINDNKLSDENMFRIAYILLRYKKWYSLLVLLVSVIMFYVVLSAFSALLLYGVYSVLILLLSPFLAFVITLLLLLTITTHLY